MQDVELYNPPTTVFTFVISLVDKKLGLIMIAFGYGIRFVEISYNESTDYLKRNGWVILQIDFPISLLI